MPELIGAAINGFAGVTKEYPVANGVTVTDGDFVYLTNGRVTSAAIDGKTLLGIVHGSNSQDPSNVAALLTTTGDAAGVAKVLVHVDPANKYLVTSDQIGTTLAASDVGQNFDVTGATGAQVLDVSTRSATTNQLEVIQFGYKGDLTKAIVIINEHKYKVNA